MEYFVKVNNLQWFRNQQGSTWRHIVYGRSTFPQFNDHRQCGFSRTHDYEECWWSNNVPVSLAALGFHWPLINHGTKLWTGSGQTDSEVQDPLSSRQVRFLEGLYAHTMWCGTCFLFTVFKNLQWKILSIFLGILKWFNLVIVIISL